MAFIERLCIGCRRPYPIEKLIRLTVDAHNSLVVLNEPAVVKQRINGRSAYFCRSHGCFNLASKGTRLKLALEGRQPKGKAIKRKIFWPLESQLIKDILRMCTEPKKTCQNTNDKEA